MSAGTPERNETSFEQLGEMARHYSSLRFAMYTVFTGILGGLFAVELGELGPLPAGDPVRVFRIASLILVLAFSAAEWRVASLVSFYQSKLDKYGPQLHLPLPPGHEFWRYVVPALMIIPLLLAGVLWIVCLIHNPETLITSWDSSA